MKSSTRIATWGALVGFASGISSPGKAVHLVAKKPEAGPSNEKMGAVNKVIAMMENLHTQVVEEGKREAESYRKFARFCKETEASKSEAIKVGENKVASLEANIGSLELDLADLESKIGTLLDDVDKSAKRQAQAKTDRAATLSTYEKNSADLQSALDSLTTAIAKLKKSKPTFLEMKSLMGVLRNAEDMVESFESSSKKNLGFLQQAPAEAPSVNMEDYKFHSSEIIGTLVKLEKKFRDEKISVDEVETKSVADFELLIQKETDITKDLNHDLDTARSAKARTVSSIATNKEDLATTQATLADDNAYFTDLTKMCSDKEKTWNQRKSARSDEQAALEAAIGIIKGTVSEKTTSSTMRLAQQGAHLRIAEAVAKSPDAMEAIEEAVEAADSFIQIPVEHDGGRDAIVTLLRNKGQDLHSTLLASLANRIATSKDPFAKVKQMIQDLIERLLAEQNKESNQKGFCDKATADAEQKRDYAAAEVRSLNSEVANLQARRDNLAEELAVLATEIGDLEESQKNADAERAEEKSENKQTVSDAQAGLEAVKNAIDILDKFYKTNAKNSVDLGLVQGPKDDAPDAGFDNGEAYLGAGAESKGVIGLLEVIEGDFTRTIVETEKAEAQAESDHLEFTTETQSSLAKKNMASKIKTTHLDETKDQLTTADASLKSQTATLKSAIEELVELKPMCVDTGMSYEERVARREDETESLKKALCVLEAYAQYGPDGSADVC